MISRLLLIGLVAVVLAGWDSAETHPKIDEPSPFDFIKHCPQKSAMKEGCYCLEGAAAGSGVFMQFKCDYPPPAFDK